MPENAKSSSREWNAAVYHRVSAPQVNWGKKVLAQISLRGDETVLDAGCGTGRLTRELLEALPRGRVVGIDLSQNMVKSARDHLALDFPERVEFLCCDLLHLPFDSAFDGIFSNATFHWVREHEVLYRGLHRALRPGGWLHAQCGGGPNISLLLSRVSQLVETPLFAASFAGFTFPWEFSDADTATQRLARAGFTNIETNLKEEPTFLVNAAEYEEFVSTAILRGHLERISAPDLRRQFMTELVRQAEADNPPFFLDYWRLNLHANKPS